LLDRPVRCFSADYAVTHIVDNMIKCRERFGCLTDPSEPLRRGAETVPQAVRGWPLPFGQIQLITIDHLA
jgi:hypothetical protein